MPQMATFLLKEVDAVFFPRDSAGITRQAIVDAFRRAGLPDVWSVQGIETHDCFTTSEYMAIDHFALTKPGESWKAIEEGVIECGGTPAPIAPNPARGDEEVE